MAIDSGINATAAARASLPMSIGPISSGDQDSSVSQTPRSFVTSTATPRFLAPSQSGGREQGAGIITPARVIPAAPNATPTPTPRPNLSRESSRGDMRASMLEPSPPRSSRESQQGSTTDVLSAYGWGSLLHEPAAVRATLASSAAPSGPGTSSGAALYSLERARASDSLGINVDDDGLEIVKVEYGLPAHLAGVPVGGRLLEVNGVAVESVAEMTQAVRRAGKRVHMVIAGQPLSRQAAAAQGLVPRSTVIDLSSESSSVAASPHSGSRASTSNPPTLRPAAATTTGSKSSFFRRLSSSNYGGKDPWDLLPDMCVEIPEGAESRYNESAYRCGVQCIELPERGQAPSVCVVHFVAEGDGLGDLQAPEGSRLTLGGSPLDIHALDLDINEPRTMISGRIYYTLPVPAQVGDSFAFTYGSATYSAVRARVVQYEPMPKEMNLTAQRSPGEKLGIDFYDDNLEVMRVAEGSPAALVGVIPGMRLRRLNGRGVRTIAHVKEQMDRHAGGDLTMFVDSWVRRPPPPLWVVPLRPMRFCCPPPPGTGLQYASLQPSDTLGSRRHSGQASSPVPSPPGSRRQSMPVGDSRLRNENERLRRELTTTLVAQEGDRESVRQAREEVSRLKDQLLVAQTKIRSDEHNLSRLASGCHGRAQEAARIRHDSTAREDELTRALQERDEQLAQMSAAMEALLDRIGGNEDIRMRVMSKDAKELDDSEDVDLTEDSPLVYNSRSDCGVPWWFHLSVTILLAASTSALVALQILQS